MRLPQIAYVIIDPAAFAPARYRPDVARQHQQKAEAAKKPERVHPAHFDPANALISPLLGAAIAGRNQAAGAETSTPGRARRLAIEHSRDPVACPQGSLRRERPHIVESAFHDLAIWLRHVV